YDSARAVAALAPALPEDPPPYTVLLDGARLLATGPGDAQVHMVAAPLDPRPAHELTATAAGQVLLSYRLTPPSQAAAPGAGDVALLREYLDPLSGRPLDPDALRAGQLVRVRLTLVTGGARVFVQLEEPLPAGATLIDAGRGGFEHVAPRDDHLVLASTLLVPGVYEHSYLVRASRPGRYAAPPPVAQQDGGAVLGMGNTGMFIVIQR
ncbi:MAG TPA: hypothetical protein VNL77_19785, partial [Roseiflexaceae bacterium]|nr:hypothetical protein [Roseiflexaceae bacterium]